MSTFREPRLNVNRDTHGNLTSNIGNSHRGFQIDSGHISVSFLPLSHVTARHADLALLYQGVTLAYCPSIEEFPQVLTEVRPTIFITVPRVYEKIYLRVQAKGMVKRAIYRWATRVGSAHRSEIRQGRIPHSLDWKLASKLVFAKVRERLGGRVQIFVSGGAPLGKELAEWVTLLRGRYIIEFPRPQQMGQL